MWSRCSFVATFVGMYALSPRLNAGLRDLLSGRISNKYVALSAFSEGLTIVGFYLASIAYGLFYQAGIVHAAEASMSQASRARAIRRAIRRATRRAIPAARNSARFSDAISRSFLAGRQTRWARR